MKRISNHLTATLVILLASFLVHAQERNHASGYKINLEALPAMFQFVDRIQRPCASGSTPFASVIANPNGNTGNVAVTTCTGGSLTVNGTAIVPGAGLPDPGSNGYVVRTALNTTVARTLTAGAGISILNGNGVAGNTTISATGGFTCAACTSNVLQKGDGAGNLADSRVSDDGTTIDANSAAGVFTAGDTAVVNNGNYLLIDDPNDRVILEADANNNNQTLSLNATSGQVVLQSLGVAQASLSVRGTVSTIELSANIVAPASTATTDLGTTSLGFKQLFLDATITPGGTTGAQTINKSAGSVNFAAAATSLVVTSNKVTANSIVMCTVATNDTTLKSVQCVPGAGSFTMFGNAAATAETRVNFFILNQ